jgi:type I restriction-modification system DNA methylase subunit
MQKAASFESFEKELNRLVSIFERNLAELKSPGYDEANLRQEFLNPFFRELGWDLENKAGLIPAYREVVVESRTDIGRADYLFRPERKPRFVCKAKKPAEELHGGFAMQSKRYAWTIGVRLALLSDFEELKIYVVTGNPDKGKPDDGLIRHYHYREYVAKAREIWDLLARDTVAGGSIERLLESLPKKLQPDRIRDFDEEFLAFLDGHRRALASDLIRHNDREDLLEGTKLNEAVQCILDRLLFIRISEARGIDMGTKLQSLLETWKQRQKREDPSLREEPPGHWGGSRLGASRGTLWNSIVRHIRALDRRPPSHVPYFNGNLFKIHFSEELVVGDVWLSEFLESISSENSSYKFGYVAVEILGTIYERFLGKIVRPHGRGAVIEEKPEVRKAGGVYYTPRYIVEYIVEHTVGKMLKGKKPEETLKLRFLDPACGSGSFLICVFDRVCEHWQQWLVDNPNKRRRDWCWLDAKTNTLHLTARIKRRILRETIYGVDLDPQAVEVTQLSLYLKMLEGETAETLERETDLFGGEEAILPPLQDNIKCGNSLIASDFSVLPDDIVRVRAFDWPVQFAPIMKAGGFDAVVGNPPYNLLQPQNVVKEELDYYHHKFTGAQYKVDIYHLFIEQSLRLVRNNGQFSFITPAPFTTNNYTANLRKLLLDNVRIRQLVTVPDGVFDQASVDNAIFTFQKSDDARSRDENEIDFVEAAAGKNLLVIKDRLSVTQSVFKETPGMIFRPPKHVGFAKLEATFLRHSKLLGDLARVNFGMQLRDRTKFSGDVVESDKPRSLKASYKPCLTGKNVDRYVTEFANLYCLFDRAAQQGGCRDEEIQFAKNKIIVRQIGAKPIAAFDSKGLCCLNTVFMIKATVEGIDERFLLGVLNSKAIGFYWQNKFSDFKQTFPKIKGTYLQQLPIPVADKARHDRLVGLVDKLLGLMPKLRQARSESERQTLQNAVTAADQQIDALVYDLYGLTKSEINLVEGNV